MAIVRKKTMYLFPNNLAVDLDEIVTVLPLKPNQQVFKFIMRSGKEVSIKEQELNGRTILSTWVNLLKAVANAEISFSASEDPNSMTELKFKALTHLEDHYG